MILDYLEGRCELDALSDAEKCAVCAAMEGRWLYWWRNARHMAINESWSKPDKPFFDEVDYYISSGTAALKLIDKFGINVIHLEKSKSVLAWISHPIEARALVSAYRDSTRPAAVAAVCALARAQWPYKPATVPV